MARSRSANETGPTRAGEAASEHPTGWTGGLLFQPNAIDAGQRRRSRRQKNYLPRQPNRLALARRVALTRPGEHHATFALCFLANSSRPNLSTVRRSPVVSLSVTWRPSSGTQSRRRCTFTCCQRLVLMLECETL